MTDIRRTDSDDRDFADLVRQLDIELAVIDGSDHTFYSQYNKIHAIKHALVCYINGTPVACGAIRELDSKTTEVKRMYTVPAMRNQGIARQVLSALEEWAKELGYAMCRLETGRRQQDAVALYTKSGYQIIVNYGQYKGIDNSVCFQKKL